MRALASLIVTSILSLNVIFPNSDVNEEIPEIIDAFTLAYDAMYTQSENFDKDYIILDMESYGFTSTTHEERQKTINYFKNKYNKPILNASLFKLQEIGLADNYGSLKIDGELLMIECIKPDPESSGIIIDGIKYVGPVAANFYTIKLKVENNRWVLKNITWKGVA